MDRKVGRQIENKITKEAKLAKIEREINEDKKRIAAIESSRTWKYAKLLRNFTPSPDVQDDPETLFAALQKELIVTREQLRQIQLDDRELNSARIASLVKNANDEAEMIPLLHETLKNKEKHDKNYKEALAQIARHFQHAETEDQNYIYSRVLEGLKIEDIPEFIVRAGLKQNDPLELEQAASFRASLTMRMRQKQLGADLPEFILDDKRTAYDFIDLFDVKRPWIDEKAYKLSELPKQEKIVVKPADGAGGRGVYLIYSFRDIVDIKNQKTLKSWDALLASMEDDLHTGRVEADEWLVEELIIEDEQDFTPASDIKFYCFYGKTGLILEINRYPGLMYAWWTRSGERVRTGKYDGYLFRGGGATEAEIEMVEQISSEIPAPFIRIDFLRSENGLVFGEFTPKPGNYDEFRDETDRMLGDLFLEAEARLAQDLRNGKQFTRFKQFEAQLKQGL